MLCGREQLNVSTLADVNAWLMYQFQRIISRSRVSDKLEKEENTRINIRRIPEKIINIKKEKMKRSGLITGILLMLLTAGNTSLNAQRGMREVMDSTRMNRHGRDLDFRQMMAPDQKNDSMFMNRMHRDFNSVPGHGTMRGIAPWRRDIRGMAPWRGDMRGMAPWRDDMRGIGPGRDAMRGMRPGNQYGMNRQSGFGMRGFGQQPNYQMGMRPNRPLWERIESIPDLTDKQKNEIAALRQQQQNEMNKLREEISGKMQTLREDHRKKLMSLLTDEQKKALEPPSDRINQVTPKAK